MRIGSWNYGQQLPQFFLYPRRFFHNLTKAWVFAPLLFLHRVYF